MIKALSFVLSVAHQLADKLLLKKALLAGIYKVLGISESWLQRYVNEKYARTTRKLEVTRNKSREEAKALWGSVAPVYQQCAVCYTDFWKAYVGFPPMYLKTCS